MNHPERGDIVKLDFYDSSGHEQAGYRPALVISPGEYNKRSGLAIVCSITNQAKLTAFEVPLPAGLKTTGVVLINHIYNVDWFERNVSITDHAPQEVLERVQELIGIFLL